MVKIVGYEKVECGCFIRKTHGLPYACELASLQIQGYNVPFESIHMFWKKLHIKEHDAIEEDSGEQLDLEEHEVITFISLSLLLHFPLY